MRVCGPSPPPQGNIRGLLGSLQTVLWEDSGWVPVSVGDLLEPGQIRKVRSRWGAALPMHPRHGVHDTARR